MTDASGLIIDFSADSNGEHHWWRIEDGVVVSNGCNADVLASADYLDNNTPGSIAALIGPQISRVTASDNYSGMTTKQAEAVANQDASQLRTEDIGDLHICSAKMADDQVWTALINSALFQRDLKILQQQNLDPDVIVPVGLLLPRPDEGYCQADFGRYAVLRGLDHIAPDEPSLRGAFVGDSKIQTIRDSNIEELLVNALKLPSLNLRSGKFAKRSSIGKLTRADWQILAWLIAAIAIATLALGLLEYSKYSSATTALEEEALQVAQKFTPSAPDLPSAERALDVRLNAAGYSGTAFSTPASVLFAAMQHVPGVYLRNLNYLADGTLSVVIAAQRSEDLNGVLVNIQEKGFAVTSSMGQDSSGSVLANVTVRTSK